MLVTLLENETDVILSQFVKTISLMTVIPSGMFKSVINLLFKYKLRAYFVGFIGLRVEKLHLHQAYKSEMCTSCKDLHSLVESNSKCKITQRN